MLSGSKKFDYHPIKNPPNYGDSNIRQNLDKFRRTKSQSLFFLIVLLLVTYILLSVLLPDSYSWFTVNSDSSYTYYDNSSTVFVNVTGSAIDYKDYTPNSLQNASTLSPFNNSSKISNKNVPKIKAEVGTSAALNVTTTDNILSTDTVSRSQTPNEEKITCQIPRLDPFDKTIKHLIKKPGSIKVNCSSKYPLLFKSYINASIVPVTEAIKAQGYKSCCYRSINRKDPAKNKKPDEGFEKSKDCYPLSLKKPKRVSKPEYEFLAIYCSTQKSKNDTKFAEKIVDIHIAVPLKPKVEERIQNYYEDLRQALNETEDTEPEVEFQNSTLSENKTIFEKSSENSTTTPSTIVEVSEDYDVELDDDNSTTSDPETFLEEEEKFDVVVLGIDAVSHMNFIRSMPKSYKYLMTKLSAIEMQGYNKIGDNTYPNMAAVLTSYNTTQMKGCESDELFDKCPFIWKEYADHGFRTSFGEDSTWMGIFNYLKSGFFQPPTDYYLRPFGNAADELIGTHKRINAKLCQGPNLSFQILLDYMRKLAFRMNHDKRYFQLIWATSLTHDYMNDAMLGDKHLFWTLEWFKNLGYLNHTALILMSDHGIRWGDIQDFEQGEIEERLPFMYFVMPTMFQERYPRAYQNLQKNIDRLTTPFDFHETLRDLLYLENLEEEELIRREEELEEMVQNKEDVPRGISHFLKVPASRTCAMAEVAEHFCTCHKTVPIEKNDSMVEQAANFVVYSINQMISKFSECAYLKLGEVKRAMEIRSGFDKWQGIKLVLETSPGGAVFDTLVEKNEKGFWKVSGTISRTNLYGSQSHCVTKKEIKLYCFCLDMIENA